MYEPTSAADLMEHYKRLKRKFRSLKPPDPPPPPPPEPDPVPVAVTLCPKISPALTPSAPIGASTLRPTEVSISMVFRCACKLWQVHPDVMRGEGKWQPLVTYRAVAMYVTLELVRDTHESKVAYYFNRDRSTVIHARNAMRARVNTVEEIRQKIDLLVMAVRQELEEARKLNA